MKANTTSDVPGLIEAGSIPEPNSGCWLWIKNANRQGYGKIKIGGRTVMAHRASYSASTGPIPAGLKVLHRCDVPPCVNPQHLFVGTTADNHADRNRKGRQASGDRQGLRLHPERAPRGERNGSARLTEADVLSIRRRLAAGERPIPLAREYGVSNATIRFIQWRKTWRHL